MSSSYSLEDKRSDATQAFDTARRYHAELREIYRYFMPWREPTIERSPDTGQRTQGQRTTDVLYDGTGPSAAFAFAANTQADWMPAFDDFFKIEPGPLWSDDGSGKRARDLQVITQIAHGLLSPIRATSSELFQDLFAGQGHMFLAKGPKERRPIRAMIAPPLEMATVDGPYGDIERWFWRRIFKARHLEAAFPEMKPMERLAKIIREHKDADVTVTQYTWWSERDERYFFHAFCDTDDTVLRQEDYRTSPWISPRLLKMPGESQGRGLAHIGLPFVKTANTARQLALRAAAFALLGIWTRRNDGVFNPETVQLIPGAMIKVAYNDGPQGPTLRRLDIPHNFDVSSVVIRDEREQIKRVLLDDEIPDTADRVRSPTEIAGRMRRWDRNRGGSTVRLSQELVVPLVQRTVDIMEGHGFIPGQTTIDSLLTKATITAPAAAAQHTGKIERTVAWLQIVVQLVGPHAMALVAEVESLMPQLGRWAGVEERFIRSKAGVDELKSLIARMAAEMQAKAAAEQQPAAAPMMAGLQSDLAMTAGLQ
jgi:Bacteriophage head to tail connecting protein